MTRKQIEWLKTHDAFGRLNKATAHKNAVALAPLFALGYIQNDGPEDPYLWDLRITERGRAALHQKPD